MKNEAQKIYDLTSYIWDSTLLDTMNIDNIYKSMEAKGLENYDEVDEWIRPLLTHIVKLK